MKLWCLLIALQLSGAVAVLKVSRGEPPKSHATKELAFRFPRGSANVAATKAKNVVSLAVNKPVFSKKLNVAKALAAKTVRKRKERARAFKVRNIAEMKNPTTQGFLAPGLSFLQARFRRHPYVTQYVVPPAFIILLSFALGSLFAIAVCLSCFAFRPAEEKISQQTECEKTAIDLFGPLLPVQKTPRESKRSRHSRSLPPSLRRSTNSALIASSRPTPSTTSPHSYSAPESHQTSLFQGQAFSIATPADPMNSGKVSMAPPQVPNREPATLAASMNIDMLSMNAPQDDNPQDFSIAAPRVPQLAFSQGSQLASLPEKMVSSARASDGQARKLPSSSATVPAASSSGGTARVRSSSPRFRPGA